MRSKALVVIIPTMMLLMILDYITAALNGPLLASLETNPLYMAVGSLVPLILINILFILFYFWCYKRSKPFWRYFLISFFVWHSIIRIYAIRANISAYMNPPSPEVIAQITTSIKMAHYQALMLSIFVPLVVTLGVYGLFWLDHKIQTRNEE